MSSNKLQIQNSRYLFTTTPPKYFFRVICVAAPLLLSACNSSFKHLPKDIEIDVPEQWQGQTSENSAETEQAKKDKEAVVKGWLKNFNDQDLDHYVQVALDKNPDLLVSASQLKQAIDQVTIAGANLWPSLQASGRKSRTVVEGQGLSETNELNTSVGVTTETRTVRTTLDISWEADIWGKLTQRKRAAAYSAKAQAETFKYAELSLVANVSRAWYNLITNKLQLDLANQRLDSFQNTASLIEENYERGLSSALDVYLSRSDVQQQVAALSSARFDYSESSRAFKTLLGEYPDDSLEFSPTLPELTQDVPTGLPAQLLTRRPDIKASELNYRSEIATAKAAQRDLYPSITFTGAIGDSRDNFSELFAGDNLIRTFVSDLTAPIFASGALRATRDQAIFSAEAAYADLLNTTLTAFEEVENTLFRETTLKEQKIEN